jgi:transcriptional regulator with XRE-family HTH domain
MDFSSKLQQLRTNSGLTQEQLAEKLFVSRVTVSKWESGRGYPNIESLKLIARVFSVTIDDLLSSNELIVLVEEQANEVSRNFRSLAFGGLDFMAAFLFVLPFFGNDIGYRIEHVALPAYRISENIVIISYILVISTAIFGVAELALQNVKHPLWLKLKNFVSFFLSICSIQFFIMTRQPYATSFLLFLMIFKGILILKKQ